jgi:hypothetical protein
MNVITTLSQIPPLKTLSVIINCGTKVATTLALVSALEYAGARVVLIDCESGDGSREHFERIARDHHLAFWWLDWPLRKHGLALDAVFTSVPAEQVMLIDSDLEIRNDRVVRLMTEALAGDNGLYGAGMLHGPAWLGSEHGVGPGVGYYAQRMWIPLVLLRTSAIVEGLARGMSFGQHRTFTTSPRHPLLSRWLAYRHWVPGLRRLGRSPRGEGCQTSPRPAFIEHDTGARMHEALCATGYRYAAIGEDIFGADVRHFHGVSRAMRKRPMRAIGRRMGLTLARNDVAAASIDGEIRNRLAVRYGIRFA